MWTITTNFDRSSSPPLYVSFSVLRQAEVGHFISLMSIMHFCMVHYLMMFVCLNFLALLIEIPLTLYANSVRLFMASSRPHVLGTMSYVNTYFLLAFLILQQTPLCSSTIMAIAPSIFLSMLMISSIPVTPTQLLKTSSPLFLIDSPLRTLVLYTISSMLRHYLTNMGSSCHYVKTFEIS